MIGKTKRVAKDIFGAMMRILFIFLILTMGFDSVTRIYYSYMPIERWIDFKSVSVLERHGEPVVVIQRRPHNALTTIFYRSLLIKYPYEKRGCSASALTVLDNPAVEEITIPLKVILSKECKAIIGGMNVNAVLHVSYILEFPYGVRRFSVKNSNMFSIRAVENGYEISAPVEQRLAK